MDPNETLRRLEILVVNIFEGEDEASESELEFATLFNALDEWIRNGGFLPKNWRK